MSKLSRKVFLSLLAVAILLVIYFFPFSKFPATPPAPPGMYTVLSYADGDTLTVNMNGSEERIRLIGVDTPETEKPDKPSQCFSNQAATYVRQAVKNKPVRLEADTKGDNRDRYSRLLRYVYSQDGTLLNKALIEQGYGFAYTQFEFDKKEEFIQAQRNAYESKIGLWGVCEITNNNGRYRTNFER